MDSDYEEPINRLIEHGPEVIKVIRKEFNLDNKENREKAISIIDDWIQTQDHFIKKNYSKSYIEKCIITSNGSLERAKIQIDKMCTVRTLMPKYFQETNLKESDIMSIWSKTYFNILPKLTEEYYRVILVRTKPNAITTSSDFIKYYKFLIFIGEYLKANDYCRGFVYVADFYDSKFSDIVTALNLVEVQQLVPIITECYGCKIKAMYIVTSSKLIEGFLKLVKPIFSEKIGSRLHAITTRSLLQSLMKGDILPEEYGGKEKSVEELHDDLIETLSSVEVQELMKEMKKAVTDESKRKTDVFNDHYMGMPGTFRTLSLD